MQKTVLIALLVVSAGRSHLIAQTTAEPQQMVIPFSDSSRTGTLQVQVVQANVTVKPYAGRDVIVTARDAARRYSPVRSNRRAEGLRRLTSGSGFAIAQDNNTVVISNSDLQYQGSDLQIQVPTLTNLKLDVELTGNISVTGVEGDIEATSLNGSVTLSNVSGSVVAHSMNGKVLVSMTRITPQRLMAFTSVNGLVDVTLPADTRANLKLKTTNGDIYTDFDIQVSSPAVHVDSSSRTSPLPVPPTPQSGLRTGTPPPVPIVWNMEKTILGTISGGGPDFELRTVNGNIYIRKAK